MKQGRVISFYRRKVLRQLNSMEKALRHKNKKLSDNIDSLAADSQTIAAKVDMIWKAVKELRDDKNRTKRTSAKD